MRHHPSQTLRCKVKNPVFFLPFLFSAIFIAAILPEKTFASTGSDTPVLAKKTDAKPNFLFILTDDQAPRSLGAYGNETCQTPNIDALAARGMKIEQAYHMGGFMGAVCTTSRHMIMSGRTLWHLPNAVTRQSIVQYMKTGNTEPTLDNPNVPDRLELNTIGAVFNRAGYKTMRTCKRGNSYLAANKQFQIIRDQSNRQADHKNGSGWHADQVIQFLSNHHKSVEAKPFFVYFGLSHPHDPRWATDELLSKYGAVNELDPSATPNPLAPALPINYLDAHPFHHGHPGLRDEVAVQGVMANRDEATIRNEKGREYACIENIDSQIGRVIQQLKQMDQLDNTYIIFTSDHGIAVGRHGLMGKQNLYEHSWRVPYIVAGPNIKQGTARGNIYLLDSLATLCDLAGISVPETNEGKSFRGVLEGKQDSVREALYGAYCGGTKPGMRCIRKGDWKLIRYESFDGKVKETQLFNLAENPFELLQEHHSESIVKLTGNRPSPNQVDLAENPAYADKLTEMNGLLLSEMVRLDDPYRFDEGFVNPPKIKKKPRKRKPRRPVPSGG